MQDACANVLAWQSLQANGRSPLGTCSPTCGWLKVEGEKALVLWQPAQLALRPAWVEGAAWQAAHAEARPRKTPDLWQEAQATVR